MVELDAGYLEAGHLRHGYALTAHKAQGATVDRAFLLGSDDLYREWGYTALSLHRDEASFYLVSPGSAERALADLADERDPLVERLEDLFGTSRAKTLATDQLDAAERRAELEQLAADHQTLQVLDGWLPPRALRLVQEWAELHRQELRDNWQRAVAHEPLVPIDPLP